MQRHPTFRYPWCVRLLSLLTVSLLAATASADPAPSSPLPFEVIRVLPSTKQVLVYDRALNTHVLLAPGSKIGDYAVVDVSGIGLILEKQQERFTVYPRAAKGLVLDLEPEKSKNNPPVIFSKVGPDAAPVQVVAAPARQVAAPQVAARSGADAKKTRLASDLGSLLAVEPQRRVRGSSGAQGAKLKP